jgi:hypothetical protein
LPERPSSACSSSTLRGDLRTSAPGAYLPAVSASGTCAHRRAARAARRPDLMDKPSLQTISSNKPARGGPQRCAAGYARCSSYPQEPDGCTAGQDSFAGKALAVLGYFQARTPLWLEAPCEHRARGRDIWCGGKVVGHVQFGKMRSQPTWCQPARRTSTLMRRAWSKRASSSRAAARQAPRSCDRRSAPSGARSTT